MSKYAIIPPCNPIRFVPNNTTLQAGYNYFQYGQVLLQHTWKSWEFNKPYMQRWQSTDGTDLQFKMTLGDTIGIDLAVYDHKGNLLKAISGGETSAPSGDLDPEGQQLITQQFYFRPANHPELDGYQYLQLAARFYYDGVLTFTHPSEPLWVADKHDKTILIEYTDKKNGFDILFKQLSPVFRLRVPSLGLKTEVGYNYVNRKILNFRTRKVKAGVFVGQRVELGGDIGISDWMEHKIKQALACYYTRIEGRRLTLPEEADFNLVAGENTAFKFFNILLIEAENQASYVHTNRRVLLWTSPGAYPYAVDRLIASDDFIGYFGSTGVVFNNSGEETTYKNVMNTQASTRGFDVEIVEDSGSFYIVNGEGADFRPLAYNILTRYYQMTYNNLATNGVLTYTLDSLGVVVDYGDSSAEWLTAGKKSAKTHTYATTGNKTFRIFHSDNWYEWQCTGSSQGKFTAIDTTSDFSAAMAKFQMDTHNFAGATLDMTFMLPAKDFIFLFGITYSNLGGITMVSAGTPPPKSQRPFKLLRGFFFQGNAFNTAAVDATYNLVYNGFNYPLTGTIATNAQTTSATVSGASLTARNALVNWSLIF